MFINTTTLEYPVSFQQIRQANPGVSFSAPPVDEDVRPYGYALVQQTEAPTPSATETLVEATPIEINEAWVQQWILRAATDEELLLRCNYQVFWNGLLISTAYQKIRSQSCLDLSLNVACTEFMAAMSDAKAGRANKNALQTCINFVVAGATLDEADLQELQQLLVDADMSNVYNL
jgi:hypothetical protein